MLGGPSAVTAPNQTESTRALARQYVEEVLIQRDFLRLKEFVADKLIQHSPELGDGLQALRAALTENSGDEPNIQYQTLHRVLAEGEFALTMCEGRKAGVHTSFYDLYRISDGVIAEHWDTVETIAPRSEWKNRNGKF